MKTKLCYVLLALALVVSACGSSTTLTPTTESLPPTSVPEALPIGEINTRLVEAPELTAIHMLNEMSGWGITETQVIRTNDGGETWFNATPEGLAVLGYNVDSFFLDVDHGWLLLPDEFDPLNAGLLYRTADGGLTWTSNSTPFGRGDMTFLDPSNAWIMADLGVGAGSNAIAVYKTDDGGATWTRSYVNDPTDPGAGDSIPLGGLKFFLTPLDMQTAWVGGTVYSNGTIYLFRTDDGGHEWFQASLTLPPDAQDHELSFEQLTFVSLNDGFLLMRVALDISQLYIYQTHDGGERWSLDTDTYIKNSGSADFISETDAVIYNGEQFFVTNDAGQHWSPNSPDVLFADLFSSMDFVSANTGWVITTDNSNHHSLYKTTDGGSTWFPIVP